MSTPENYLVLITITGPDQVGLISAITGRLFEMGGNLNDTSFAVLGTGFEFSAVCDIPGEVIPEQIEASLKPLDGLSGATVRVEPFGLGGEQAENARITHRIEISGGDRPGLIARLSEAFLDYGANVVRMNSVRVPGAGGRATYITRFSAYIPEGRETSCLAAIGNTAQQLQCEASWEKV